MSGDGPGAASPSPDQRAPAARLTGRAAVLAVVICAIALSLAYPVREYVAQRKQIDQLVAEQQMMVNQVRDLIAERARLNDKNYIEHLAGSELDMCMPNAQCYVIQDGPPVLSAPKARHQPGAPWYTKLWQSVEQANKLPAK